jgi:hypothetical protein
MFDGIYVTEHLSRTLALVGAELAEGQRIVLKFRESGYKTTAECAGNGLKVTAELTADWARGAARRELTSEQVAALADELADHGPAVWVHIPGPGPITLKQPT